MYVTTSELKAEVRAIMIEIKSLAKDLGGEIKDMNESYKDLKEAFELQQQLINKLAIFVGFES